MGFKSTIKKLIPAPMMSSYHYLTSTLAAYYHGMPSRKMIVIGVTGTKGKTSVANFLWAVLNGAGFKTGLIGTANIRIGNRETMNEYHMTMPGRFVMQGKLREMEKAGCKYCVVETTSEGLAQWRHQGIQYDMAIFTNLTPEHLPSHGGSFENYKAAKGKLFGSLAKSGHKYFNGQKIDKVIIVNYDSPHSDYFLNFWADKKWTFGLKEGADFQASKIENTPLGVEFEVGGNKFELGIIGTFNVYNALPAIALGGLFGIPYEKIREGLKELRIIPGRMEKIDEGQDFTVIVDYAHEKESMTALMETAENLVGKSGGKIIVLLGAEGGGRDKTKRPIMGEIVGKRADFVVVSNVDPYEDDPTEICEDIARAAEKSGKKRGENLFVIEDRREGVDKALSLAQKDDLVLITGKGAEQSIVIGGKKFEWDDRKVVREEIKKMIK